MMGRLGLREQVLRQELIDRRGLVGLGAGDLLRGLGAASVLLRAAQGIRGLGLGLSGLDQGLGEGPVHPRQPGIGADLQHRHGGQTDHPG